ncbi:MAG: helix-turn-helix transcriptional regulator, partial [Pseudomonadota bacterium]
MKETNASAHVDPSRTLDRETFGKRLRGARKALGWTLAHLAELSGVSITTISRAERGQLALGYDNFAAIG